MRVKTSRVYFKTYFTCSWSRWLWYSRYGKIYQYRIL